MSRFFDPNEIGEFLESQQNKFIGLCDLDLEIAGYGKKIQFFINLGDGYEICYEAYEIPEDEFYESRLFVNPVFLDAKA